MELQRLIDGFVDHVNHHPRERKPPEDLPPIVRVGPPDERGDFDWRIARVQEAPWVATLEAGLPFRLPASFLSLVNRYAFPDFEIGSLWLFANTGESVYLEMRLAMLRDESLAAGLLRRGYLQFARPAGGSYDPICFDTGRRGTAGEYPIVRIDHEAVLQRDAIRITEEIAGSFREFVGMAIQTGCRV